MTRMPRPTPLRPAAPHAIVPPWLLDRIAEAAEPRFPIASEAARRSLLRDRPMRELRNAAEPPPSFSTSTSTSTTTTTSTTGTSTSRPLPRSSGRRRSPTGASPTRRARRRCPAGSCVARANPRPATPRSTRPTTGSARPSRLFTRGVRARRRSTAPGCRSTPPCTTATDYDNAFWDGERMVFGDGDGEVFRRLHRLAQRHRARTHPRRHRAHGGPRYQGQSGALNESMSDVFGALVEQYALGQSADAGELAHRRRASSPTAVEGARAALDGRPGHRLRRRRARARSAARAHARLHRHRRRTTAACTSTRASPTGRSPSPRDALGGCAWEHAGRIWYDTLTSGRLRPDDGFLVFAAETLRAAEQRFGVGSREARAVESGWREVGIEPRARRA